LIKQPKLLSPKSKRKGEVAIMTKLLVTLAAIIILAALAVTAIGTYLGPDGLAHCDAYPIN